MNALIPAKGAPANGESIAMPRNRLVLLMALLIAAPATAAPGADRDPVEGIWRNRAETLVVRIAPCGEALCGTVVNATEGAKESVRKAGTERLVGTRVLAALRKSSADTYNGQVFNPNLNIHAAGTVTLVSPTVLIVRGCVLAGLICRQQHWFRVN